jgi:glycosyltransferase involved in cell wall biosynthesis
LSNLYYSSATVLSTSSLEGFCMPVLEAALCGCIPVVPNRATFRENFRRFGVLVPPHETQYGNHLQRAEEIFTREQVAQSAREFHATVRDTWNTCMDAIADAAKAGTGLSRLR